MSDREFAVEPPIRDRLRRLQIHLQVARAGVVVAAAALRHQNADRDEDIACVLEHCVGARLAEQIECVAELMAPRGAAPACAGGRDPAEP